MLSTVLAMRSRQLPECPSTSPSNFQRLVQSGSIKRSFVLDPSMHVPDALISDREGDHHDTLYLESRGRVDLNIWLIRGANPCTRASIWIRSSLEKSMFSRPHRVALVGLSTPSPIFMPLLTVAPPQQTLSEHTCAIDISVKCDLHLTLPHDFVGPIFVKAGKIRMSKEMESALAPVSEVHSEGVYIMGRVPMKQNFGRCSCVAAILDVADLNLRAEERHLWQGSIAEIDVGSFASVFLCLGARAPTYDFEDCHVQ